MMGSGLFKGRGESELGFGCGGFEGPPTGFPGSPGSAAYWSCDLRLVLALCACLVFRKYELTQLPQRLTVRMQWIEM